jgi:sugar (pentulose or hexulose) kinase
LSVAVFDVGKTHVRLAVASDDGAALETLSRANAIRAAPPYPHFDVEDVFEWLVAGLAALAERHALTEIVPVAHGACAALVAGDGLALPLLDYEFAGPEAVAGYEASARRFAETFSPRLPAGLNLGRQLAWLASEFPQEFARTDRLLLLPQYWAWRLCGVAASELTSLGCHTDLWAPERGAFSEHALRSGAAALFPPLAKAWQPLGRLRADVARRTGIGAACRVLAGIHDSNAWYLAQRAERSAPFAVVSSGTWTIVMAHGGELRGLDPRRDTLANVDAFGDPVPTARFMGGREFAAIAGPTAGASGASDEALLAAIERGDLALPSFAPGMGPFAAASGRLEIASPAHPSARDAVAALYCALVTDTCLALVGARGDVVVEGPIARNRAFLRSLAGLRPAQRVLASPDPTGTLAGAACLAVWSRGGPRAPRERSSTRAVEPLAADALAAYRARWRAALG